MKERNGFAEHALAEVLGLAEPLPERRETESAVPTAVASAIFCKTGKTFIASQSTMTPPMNSRTSASLSSLGNVALALPVIGHLSAIALMRNTIPERHNMYQVLSAGLAGSGRDSCCRTICRRKPLKTTYFAARQRLDAQGGLYNTDCTRPWDPCAPKRPSKCAKQQTMGKGAASVASA